MNANFRLKSILSMLVLLIISLNSFTQNISPKRGFCGNPLNIKDLKVLQDATWFYNWGQKPSVVIEDTLKNYLDYCPMIWGGTYNKSGMIDYLSKHPEIEYLMGFNEPNFIEQANMGPREAASLWPELEEIADMFDLKLVSPVLNFSYSGGAVIEEGTEYTDPIQYLDDFFEALPDTSRVDYISIHGYFDNAGALPWYIGLYEKYGKPLWLTEFNHSAGFVNESTQQKYMVEAFDYLEQEPMVFRYAWFLARSTQENTNLLMNSTTGKLTDLGRIFVNMSGYNDDYIHSTEQIIEAEHYVDMQGIHLINVEDTSGIIAANDFDEGDWMDYSLYVEETRDYFLELRVAANWVPSFSVYDGTELLGTFETEATGGLENWQTFAIGINLTEGNHKLRIQTLGRGWKLNWWRVSRSSTVNMEERIADTKSILIYPNPVSRSGLLKIETAIENYSCRITSLQGSTVHFREGLNKDTTLDLSEIEAGYYIITIDSGNYNKSTSIVLK